MDLNSRQYVVSLDMTRTGSIRESFEMRHNDDNELIIELRDSEGIIDLNTSGVINATLLVTRKDKVDIPLAGTITPEGRASFKLKRASLEKQGMVEVVAQFYFANDVRISTPTLIFNVLRDPSAGAVGDEGDDRTLIEIILNDAPALLEQLQTAYDELVIQKAAFAQFQTDSETAFSNAQNQRTTDFNADQAARNTAFEDAQTQRATDFNTSQGERATLFNQAQTDRQNDYQTWKDAKDTELNQLASDTENSKLAADGATANANNAAVEAMEAAEEATGAVAEVTAAKQSTVKNKTFANLDGRMEELESDTFIPIKNEVVNGDFRNGTAGWVFGSFSSNVAVSSEVATVTQQYASYPVHQPATIIAGRKYYLSALIKNISVSAGMQARFSFGNGYAAGQNGDDYFSKLGTSAFTRISEILTANANYTSIVPLRFTSNAASSLQYMLDNFIYIDLTTVFGKGNEPTVEEMDRLLAKYPNNFFDGTVNLTPKLLDDLRYLTSDVQMPLVNRIENGNFANGLEKWTGSSSIRSVANNIATLVATASGGSLYNFPSNIKLGDIYYQTALVKADSNLAYMGSNQYIKPHSGSGLFERLTIREVRNSNSHIISFFDNRTSGWTEIQVKEVLIINLTEIFGAGNEPTQAQMDALLGTYPNSWFDGTVNLAENKRIIPFLLKRLEMKADKAQEAWITPTLLNGTTVQSGFDVGYMKDALGFVHLKGCVNIVGTLPLNIFALPTGYRVSVTKGFAGQSNNSNFVPIYINTAGQVLVSGTNKTAVFLDGITFKAEA